MENIEKRIIKLRQDIEYHRKKYYNEDAPEISDYEFDMMFRELEELEAAYPEFHDDNSPIYRVGGEALDKFEKVAHNIPLRSLTGYHCRPGHGHEPCPATIGISYPPCR